jgi:phosphate starvation-inducible PhoH-like protein
MAVKKRKLSRTDEQEIEDFMKVRENMTPASKMESIQVKCKTPGQKDLLESIKNNQITICSGRAGSGKTYISCAQASKFLKAGDYKKIILIKSIVTLKNEEIGYLKGSLEEKINPFIDSFIDNFDKIIGKANFEALRAAGSIEVIPIAFARGRTLDNSIIIIDEGQNIDIDNMKSLMTRIGENSKMIILGDVKQKDIKNKKSSSLEYILNRFKGVEDFGTIELYSDSDVVRNPIIKIIEEKFEIIETDFNEAVGKR